MLSISIGPLALPVAPLLLLCSVGLASWLAGHLAARANPPEVAIQAGNAVFHAALLGLLVGRAAHLALNLPAYLASPWSALDLRDGGWLAAAGLPAAAVWLLWRATRHAALRRPVAIASLAGGALWLAGSLATGMGRSQTMPTLAFADLDSGAPVTLAQAAQGRPVVVNLWASWCGPCRQEMPVLAAAQQRETGVGFVFVNQGESAEAVRRYLSQLGPPGQPGQAGQSLRDVLLDAGSALGPAVGSGGLPTTLFYDALGRQVDAHFGVLNAAALESRLRALRPPN